MRGTDASPYRYPCRTAKGHGLRGRGERGAGDVRRPAVVLALRQKGLYAIAFGVLVLAVPEAVHHRVRVLAGLGAVSLVDQNHEPPAFVVPEPVHRLRGELLDRRQDDLGSAPQSGPKLPRRPVDLLNIPGGRGEPLHHALDLLVQNLPVRQDDHRIKNGFARGIVKEREVVRGPRDRVRLPGPRGVLHQIIVPRAVPLRVPHQVADAAELMIPRPDERAFLVRGAEAADDREQRLFREHGGLTGQAAVKVGDVELTLVPDLDGRVSGTHLTRNRRGRAAAVERDEVRRGPGEARRHPDLVLIHREVQQSPLIVMQERGADRFPVALILLDRVLVGAAGSGTLQLHRHDGNAVDEHDDVDLVSALHLVNDLTDGGHPVPRVEAKRVRSREAVRSEPADPDVNARSHLEAVPQRGERALLPQLLAKTLEHVLPHPGAVMVLEQTPSVGLRVLDVADDVIRNQGQLLVVIPWLTLSPA